MSVAAVIAVAGIVVITLFQAGLALGAPWGAAAWGGRHAQRLPNRLRLASGLASLLLYPTMLALVIDAGDLADFGLVEGSGAAGWMWVTCGFFGLGTVVNAFSRSKVERWWAPVSFLIAASCGIIAVAL